MFVQIENTIDEAIRFCHLERGEHFLYVGHVGLSPPHRVLIQGLLGQVLDRHANHLSSRRIHKLVVVHHVHS